MSLPGMLRRAQAVDRARWVWRTPLERTQPFWDGWCWPHAQRVCAYLSLFCHPPHLKFFFLLIQLSLICIRFTFTPVKRRRASLSGLVLGMRALKPVRLCVNL